MTITLQTTRVFITHRPLPLGNRPVYVLRYRGLTIAIIHPTARRIEVTAAFADMLTDDEGNYIRAMFGAPPRGQHMGDQYVTDEPVFGDDGLPPGLVLPRRASATAPQADSGRTVAHPSPVRRRCGR